jgi:transmembrane sensor
MMSAAGRGDALSIDATASEWVVRQAGGLTAAEQAAFDQWYAEDGRHAGSFLRASALACMVERSGASTVDDEGDPEEVAHAAPRPNRRQMLFGGAALASVAAGLVAFAVRSTSISSAIGETRSLPLRDGSTALLNTASTVRIAYSSRARRIDLVDGEAWFDVAHDAARPFEVRSGRLNVRAVGTAFAVRHFPDGGGMVTVTEGVVLAWLDDRPEEAIRIAAGDRGVIADDVLRRETRPTGEEDRQLAWRTGMIVLDGQTLGEAVADFNRYNPVKLVVGDERLAGRRIYGTFRARDPEALGRAVAISFNTSVAHSAGSIVIG